MKKSEWQPQRLSCFNRTFMELKSQNMQIKLGESQVLIVPLWN